MYAEETETKRLQWWLTGKNHICHCTAVTTNTQLTAEKGAKLESVLSIP